MPAVPAWCAHAQTALRRPFDLSRRKSDVSARTGESVEQGLLRYRYLPKIDAGGAGQMGGRLAIAAVKNGLSGPTWRCGRQHPYQYKIQYHYFPRLTPRGGGIPSHEQWRRRGRWDQQNNMLSPGFAHQENRNLFLNLATMVETQRFFSSSSHEIRHEFNDAVVEDFLIPFKSLDIAIISFPPHPFRLRRQIPFVRIEIADQP